MTNRRRSKKRHRNKSSPQTLSIPKKHRQSEAASSVSSDVTEQASETVQTDQKQNTDTESIADLSVLSEIKSVADSETDSVENYFETIDQPSSIMENMGTVGDQGPDPSQQSQSILHSDLGEPPFMNNQNFMDPNAMPPHGLQSHPMNITPQQMQHLINMSPHMQPPPPPMIVQQNLSDDDVLRIALKMQELLSKEIDKLVEQKVALKVAPLQMEVENLKKSLSKVQKELKDVSVRNDDLEQYSRRSCLRISGIAEKSNEDTTRVVIDLADRCGANISIQDIDRSHRVGRPIVQEEGDFDISDEPQRSTKTREIIVKLRSHGARLQLLKGRAFFRERKEKIYINEDLTKTRKNLAFVCRKLKKDSKSSVERTWVYNGNVLIQDIHENKVRVTSLDDLDPYKPPDEDNGQ